MPKTLNAGYRVQFDDLAREKLTRWEHTEPDTSRPFDERTGMLEGGRAIAHGLEEPVLEECRHFPARVNDRFEPKGCGEFAVAVVRTIEALSESLRMNGRPVRICGRR